MDHAAADAERKAEHYEHQSEVTEMESAQQPDPEVPLMEEETPIPAPFTRESTMDIGKDAAMPLVAEATMNLDGIDSPIQRQIQTLPAKPSLDRSFTSNFVQQTPVDQKAERGTLQKQGIPDDWPSVGDDKTFGELLDKEPVNEMENVGARKPGYSATDQWPSADDDDQTFGQLLGVRSPPQIDQQRMQEVAEQESMQQAAPDVPSGEKPEEDLAAAWGAALDDDDMLEVFDEPLPDDGADLKPLFDRVRCGAGFSDGEVGFPVCRPTSPFFLVRVGLVAGGGHGDVQ